MHTEFTGWEYAAQIKLAGSEQITIPPEPDILSVEDRIFIDAVKSGRPDSILATYEDGLKTTAVSWAVNQSIESGEVVKISV